MTEHEVIKKEEKGRFFWVKLWSITLIILSWLVLIGLKVSSDISLRIPLAISITITIIGGLSYFGQSLAKKWEEKKNELPQESKPISKEQAKELVYKIVEERWDHILKPESEGIRGITTHTVQGSQVYCFEVYLLYGSPIYIIINATRPDEMPTIVPILNTKNPTLTKLINAKSSNPKDDPDVIEETINDELSGRTKTIRKQIQKRKEEPKKEEDLA